MASHPKRTARRVILAIALLLAAGAAAAQQPGPNRQKYEAQLGPLMRDLGLASVAQACGIRSERWLTNIAMSINMFRVEAPQRFGLTRAEVAQSEAYGEREAEQVMKAGVSCSRLVNSKDMDRLDALERRVTGNYH